MKLKINEIFYSLQGETTLTGFPSLFIRLSGCNLNCSYCDTEYAKAGGIDMSIEDIIDDVKKYKSAHHITITGGEPMAQEKTITLIKRLTEMGLNVQVETNGSISLRNVHLKARKIIDVKTPSSGEEDSFLQENLNFITENDEIKFVICDEEDYRFSKNFVEKHLDKTGAVINFSPVFGKIDHGRLADMIIEDRLCVRLNVQLHKIIDFK